MTAPTIQRGKPAHVWQGVQKMPFKTDRPWVFRCPAPMCFYNVSATSEKDAKRLEETHQHQADACPWFAGGSTTYGWSVFVSQFVTPIWQQLDARMDIIMDREIAEGETKERAKYEARGLAVSLAILMPPFFDSPDDIAREAKRRYSVRQQEDFDPERAEACYQTKGIGRLAWKAAVERASGGEQQTLNQVASNSTRTKTTQLDEASITGIKTMLGSGMFTAEQLATTYKVSVAYIKSLA